jgi:hypothetical protein
MFNTSNPTGKWLRASAKINQGVYNINFCADIVRAN